MRLLVSIEGNIGSGKSTLLDELKQAKFAVPHAVVQEDVKGWTSFMDSQGNNILQKYYQDQSKYGYCFQSLVLISRVNSVFEAINQIQDGIIILERSHLTDLMIFAKMLREKGAMTEIEWLAYLKCSDIITKMLNIHIDLFIYLQASPSTCMRRIAQRNRKGEDLIPLRYITDLHDKHEEWLNTVETSSVIHIDGNVDLSDSARSFLLQTLISDIEKTYSSAL